MGTEINKMGWEFFSAEELRCKCGCGDADMDPAFMVKLIAMRREAGFPFPLSSAYRCPAHNDRESGTGKTGPHTTRRAVDVRVSGARAYWIVANAARFGFSGIGVHQKGPHDKRFIHLDDSQAAIHPRPWVWSY